MCCLGYTENLRFLRLDLEQSPFVLVSFKKCSRESAAIWSRSTCNFYFCCAFIFASQWKTSNFLVRPELPVNDILRRVALVTRLGLLLLLHCLIAFLIMIQWNPAFWPPRYKDRSILFKKKLSQSIPYLKNPFNTATVLIHPDFCGPWVTGLKRFHCT